MLSGTPFRSHVNRAGAHCLLRTGDRQDRRIFRLARLRQGLSEVQIMTQAITGSCLDHLRALAPVSQDEAHPARSDRA